MIDTWDVLASVWNSSSLAYYYFNWTIYYYFNWLFLYAFINAEELNFKSIPQLLSNACVISVVFLDEVLAYGLKFQFSSIFGIFEEIGFWICVKLNLVRCLPYTLFIWRFSSADKF